MHPLFRLQFLLQTLNLLKPTSRWFQRTFFPTEILYGTYDVRVDVYNRRRRIASYTSPEAGANFVEKGNYVSRRYKPAYVNEGHSYTPAELYERAPGATFQSVDSNSLAQLIARDQFDILDMIDRLKELACVQALLDHQVPVRGNGLDETVDLLFSADQTVTLGPARKWDTGTAIDIYEDFQAEDIKMRARTGRGIDVVVLGEKARRLLMADERFLKRLDNRRVELGQLQITGRSEEGVKEIGTLDQGAIRIVSYHETYVDPFDLTDAPDGTEKPIFPSHKVLCAATGARTEFHYGAIEDFDASALGPLAKLKQFPKSWMERNPSKQFQSIQSAPLPVPVENGAYSTLVVADPD